MKRYVLYAIASENLGTLTLSFVDDFDTWAEVATHIDANPSLSRPTVQDTGLTPLKLYQVSKSSGYGATWPEVQP